MANYHLTNLAVIDLSNIWNYTFDNWSEQQADYYYEQLILGFENLSTNQELGRDYSEIAKGLLGLKVNRHIIFYRIITTKTIEIVRILHERMDLKNKFK